MTDCVDGIQVVLPGENKTEELFDLWQEQEISLYLHTIPTSSLAHQSAYGGLLMLGLIRAEVYFHSHIWHLWHV